MVQMTILFLDFDGVLHPSPTANETVFSRLQHLWAILRARPDVDVVLSTSWREHFDPDVMLDFVTSNGAENLRARFIGSNPVLRCAQSFQREAECLAWLHGNGMHGRPWLAVDDDSAGFEDSTHLYLVDQKAGLTQTDVLQILARFQQKV